MLYSIREVYVRWKLRLYELFTKFDEGVESILVCAIIWQAWRISRFIYGWDNYIYSSKLDVIGLQLSKDAKTFYSTIFDLHILSFTLIIISICSIYGLMEKREPFRIIGMITACGWWFISGTLLTIHSPLHDAGGLYYLFGISGILIYAHRFVMLDREKDIQFIDTAVKVYNVVYTYLHRYRKLHPHTR